MALETSGEEGFNRLTNSASLVADRMSYLRHPVLTLIDQKGELTLRSNQGPIEIAMVSGEP